MIFFSSEIDNFFLPILTLIYDVSMRFCENAIPQNCKNMNTNFRGKSILDLNQHFFFTRTQKWDEKGWTRLVYSSLQTDNNSQKIVLVRSEFSYSNIHQHTFTLLLIGKMFESFKNKKTTICLFLSLFHVFPMDSMPVTPIFGKQNINIKKRGNV